MFKGADILAIYCPDCRGRFEVKSEDFQEEEILECPLCAAEVLVTSENPPRVKLFSEDDDF